MTLSDFMAAHSITDTQLAAEVGCSVGAVRKWRSGERTPRPDQMLRISAATRGKVTPNDFLSMRAAS